jgi:hypothetical protein
MRVHVSRGRRSSIVYPQPSTSNLARNLLTRLSTGCERRTTVMSKKVNRYKGMVLGAMGGAVGVLAMEGY